MEESTATAPVGLISKPVASDVISLPEYAAIETPQAAGVKHAEFASGVVIEMVHY